MMNKTRRLWAGVAILAVWGWMAACEGSASGPGADDGLAGAYQMKVYRGYPLPYFDFRTQEQVRSSTLHLDGEGAFTEVVESLFVDTLQGSYTLAAGDVVLRDPSGGERVLSHQSGVLRGGTAPAEMAYVRQGGTVPAEYRLRVFTLRTCDGHAPAYLDACSGLGYHIYSSTVWLSDAGRFYRSDVDVGASVHMSGTYTLAPGDSVVFSTPQRGWTARSRLRADSLTTGTFVYVAPAR